MKRIVRIGLLMITMSIGIVMTSKAVEQICITATIVCPQGGGSNCLICGDSVDEINCLYEEMYGVVCGN